MTPAWHGQITESALAPPTVSGILRAVKAFLPILIVCFVSTTFAQQEKAPSLTDEAMKNYRNPLVKPTNGNPLNEPAKPTTTFKTTEDKKKPWKEGESAKVVGRVIQNTSDGLLIDCKGRKPGKVISGRQVSGIVFLRGSFTTNAGAGVEASATFVDYLMYETLLHSRQTVPTFQVK